MSVQGAKRGKIAEAYREKQVSEEVLNIKLDVRKYNKLVGSFTPEKMREEHERMNIAYVESLEDMRNIYKNDKKSNVSVEERWEQYLERDKLIVTGQYQAYKASVWQSNYVNQLIANGYSQELIDYISKLTPQQFESLASLPNIKKGDTRTTSLPSIKDTYRSSGGLSEDDRQRMEDDIWDAIIDWENKRKHEIPKKGRPWEEQRKGNEQRYKRLVKQGGKNGNMLRMIPRVIRNQIDALTNDYIRIGGENFSFDTGEAKFALMDLMISSGHRQVKHSKNGDYLPFFAGSTEYQQYLNWKANH